MSVITLANDSGITARLTNVGSSLMGLEVPDRRGRSVDVLPGFDDEERYRTNSLFLGAMVGRCANRIAGASFEIDGVRYGLERNDGENSLHSGSDCWAYRTWDVIDHGPDHATLQLVSPDGDQGFPGEVTVRVTYRLLGRSLDIVHEATTTAPTIINVIDHSYFNLNGHDAGTILGHELTINAGHYLPTHPNCLPTGEVADVAGTPWDFREPHTIGERIALVEGGYDNSYEPEGAGYRHMVRLVGDQTGIVMDVWADTPAIQLYSGNFLDVRDGKGGACYGKRAALALEAQVHPDAIHHPEWAQPIARPGRTYRTRRTYAFPEQ